MSPGALAIYRFLRFLFRDPQVLVAVMPRPAFDPLQHGEPNHREATVVFSDHAFMAGHYLDVRTMATPHRHTQFEINHVLSGAMTYAFEGSQIEIVAGTTSLFFGMVPHQVTARAPGTRFVCLYLPARLLIDLRVSEALRQSLFQGSFVQGLCDLDTDASAFQRWRSDLLSGDRQLIAIARDELGGRLRRLQHDGWVDRRQPAPPHPAVTSHGSCRPDKVEAMTRYIAEHVAKPLRVKDVAAAVGLNANYAMTLFKMAVGTTIADYHTRNRLDAAQTLLACSDMEIAAVAFASGYGSLSQFYQAFRVRFGTSPATFRRSLRAAAPGGPQPGLHPPTRSRAAPPGQRR